MGITLSMPHAQYSIAPAVLNADRADLGFEAVILENDAVVVVGLGVNDLAEI
jgi:hypothetical protein